MSVHDPVYTVYMYVAYLVVSIAMTVWVARTLHRNGRVFLVESFLGNETLADSVNHLLVVGFYLINTGYITLSLQYGKKAHDMQSAIEAASWKFGLVLLVLGTMHFLNLAVFSQMRKRGLAEKRDREFETRMRPPEDFHGALTEM